MSESIIYIPDFVSELNQSISDRNQLDREFKHRDWICDGLKGEIESCFPKQNDVYVNRSRNKESFKQSFDKLFPINRLFAACDVQLEQVIKAFAKTWAFVVTKAGKLFQCHYSERLKFKKTMSSAFVPNSSHTTTTAKTMNRSLKDVFKCPFVLRYSYVKRPRAEKGLTSLYKVKITCM